MVSIGRNISRAVVSSSGSQWRPVTAGVHQGLGLGLVLLNIVVGDRDSGIKGTHSTSAGDTELSSVGTREGSTQRDRGGLERWDQGNPRMFNKAKGEVLPLGWDSPG